MPEDNRKRTPPLTSLQNIGIELARLYRRAKRGDITTSDGYKLAQILVALKQCLETAALEQRLADLQAAVAQDEHQHFRPRVVS